MNIVENSFCPLNFLGFFGASWLVWAGSCEIDVYSEVVRDRETIETGYRVCFFSRLRLTSSKYRVALWDKAIIYFRFFVLSFSF